MKPMLKLEPSWLPPETQVGLWKVKAFHGSGSYGAVFRAVRARRAHGGWVALKVAFFPGDQRFEREVELLSRIRNPCVPRLLGRGEWRSPEGAAYPYLVMEWVEGMPLYEWATRCNPTPEEQARVLGRVARALEATHEAQGVHRDVKGDNIQVGASGLHAFLTDYGAGNYAGAARLTREGLPPGTDTYRSPEAWEFALHRPRNSMAVYQAQPADDVYALGVSAYRLVTGVYPPPVEVREEESGPGRLEWQAPLPPQELNPKVDPRLSALILRMLSKRSEERPNGRELAEALEERVRELRRARASEEAPAPARRTPAWERAPAWVRYAACAVLGGVVAAVAVGWGLRLAREGVAEHTAGAQPQEVDPVGLGDTELTAPSAQEEGAPDGGSLAAPMPEKPLEGQRRAPHCRPPLVTINGGCWVKAQDAKPPCGDLAYEWERSCYVPYYHPPRKPTSVSP